MRTHLKKLIIKLFPALLFAVFILFTKTTTAYGFNDLLDVVEHNDSLNGAEIKTAGTLNETANLKSFYVVLKNILTERGWKTEDLCDETDLVGKRIMREYGAVFIVADGALPPPVCMFANSAEVESFQQKAGFTSAEIAGIRIELQSSAMKALLAARAEAVQKNLNITPRDGAEAGRRNYADTIRLWKSRFEPACEYWKKQNKLTAEQIEKLKSLTIKEQVKEVLALEQRGIFFNKFFNNSILYSVAAPGTSQHLSMLALDINEFEQAPVREILAKHGWFQTVKNDAPHFTFLGRRESELKSLGLKKIATDNGKFWIPDA